MKFSDYFRTICVIIIALLIGRLAYKKLYQQEQTTLIGNALTVKKFISKYKRPARIEIQSFIKSNHTRFKNDVQEIKKIKAHLDPNSNFFMELQLFTDENDSNAPLIVQFRFLELKSKNLIQEQSLNLF